MSSGMKTDARDMSGVELLGTLWQSRDPRDRGRTVKVLRMVSVWDTPQQRTVEVENTATGRRTIIQARYLRVQGRRGWTRLS